MTEVQRVIDGDTIDTGRRSTRFGYVNTPESKHKDETKNTPEGERAAKFTADVIPQGSQVQIADYGNDHHGRQVGGVTRNINGVDIDMSLVLLDQDMSSYYTQFGEHPDPRTHDQYKAYYSKHVPYQFDDVTYEMTPAQVEDMAGKHAVFKNTYQKFTEGKATQDELDTAMVDLYKDPVMVAHYRQHLANWNRPIEQEDERTIRGAMRVAMHHDPELRKLYNRGVLNGHLAEEPVPEARKSFWENTSHSFSMLNTVAQASDLADLWTARNADDDIDLPDTEITAGVPPQYHAKLLAEAANYSAHSATVMRDQIIEDLENRAVFDDMPLYAQFGYGAMAVLADPSTLVLGGAAAAGVKATTAGIRTWEASRLVQNTAVVGSWATAGGLEGLAYNAPRLAADHTYTPREYYLDSMLDAGFGVAIGSGVAGFKYMTAARNARQAEIEGIQRHAAGEEAVEPTVDMKEARESAQAVTNVGTVELDVSGIREILSKEVAPEPKEVAPEPPKPTQTVPVTQPKVDTTTTQAPQQTSVQPPEAMYEGLDYVPLDEITKLSHDDLNLITKTLRKQLGNYKITTNAVGEPIRLKRPEANYLGHLANNIKRLNKNVAGTDLVPEAQEINAIVARIVAQYPNGVPPTRVRKDLNDFLYGQRKYNKVNAMDDWRAGDLSELNVDRYIDNLTARHDIDTTAPPMKTADFVRELDNEIAVRADMGDDMSIWRDAVEGAKNNQHLQVAKKEQLQGILWKAFNDFIDTGARKAIVKEHPPQVARSASEIHAILKREFPNNSGRNKAYYDELQELIQRFGKKQARKIMDDSGKFATTPAYRQRLAELKGDVVNVSKEVRAVGEVVELKSDVVKEQRPKDTDRENAREERSMDTQESFERRSLVESDNALTSKSIEKILEEETKEGLFKRGTIEESKRALDKRRAELTKYGDEALYKHQVADVIQHLGDEELTSTKKDLLDADILPRVITITPTKQLIDKPSVGNMKELKAGLMTFLKEPRGVTKETSQQQARLAVIAKNIGKDRNKVYNRVVKAGAWTNVEDVLRASHTLTDELKVTKARIEANKAKLESTLTKLQEAKDKPDVLQETRSKLEANKVKLETRIKELQSTQSKPVADVAKESTKEPAIKALTEEELEIFADNNSGTTTRKMPDDEFKQVIARIDDAYERMVKNSAKGISHGLLDFVRSGEQGAGNEAIKPNHLLDAAGRLITKLTEDIGSKLQNSELTAAQYMGFKVTETGAGFGGKMQRGYTASIIRDAEYKNSILQILPQYVSLMDEFVAKQGKGAVSRMNAQNMAGADNVQVKKFNREVFKVQELRRQGRSVPTSTDSSVLKFVDQWNKYMEYNHTRAVENNIGGFTKDRKVRHYIPHTWIPNKLEYAIKVHGIKKVEELLKRGYQSASNNGTNPVPTANAADLAKRQIAWIRKQTKELDPTDQFSPVADSRAKQRLDIDTTVEYQGLSILDLMDDEVLNLGIKYSNRLAGRIGLAKATNGMLRSDLDIAMFKENLIQEGIDKGIKTKKYEQYFDDVIDMMLARPTRGGLSKELMHLRDATTLTRMGGLGTAQAIETGNVITKAMLHLFSSDKVVKKIFKEAGIKEEGGLIREIQAVSGLTDDIEWLNRQASHLDIAELKAVNGARQLSLWIADKATMGAYKAPASRLLGKVTGYNAIRKAQSKVVQASFVIDVAKHFKDGTAKMSVARMADVGLTDTKGINKSLKDVFDNIVEYGEDGLVSKLNADKWPTEVREQFQYALLRDEAQQIQRTHVGELPPWMNSPLMALIFQFRQMPIVANNKQLRRSLAFADREAVTSVLLNTAIAGMVRWSKFAALGVGAAALTGKSYEEPTEDAMQTQKYISALGILPDAYDLVTTSYAAGQLDADDAVDKMLGQVPVYGLMSDYYDAAAGDTQERIDAAFGLMPLGNIAAGDMVHTWAQHKYGE